MPERSQRRLTHPTLGAVEAWNDASHDATTSIVTYETHYRVVATGRHLAARSQIKFTPKDELEGLVAEAGLHVTRRSEEHTSELQSLMRISYAVFCLKKKKSMTTNHMWNQ